MDRPLVLVCTKMPFGCTQSSVPVPGPRLAWGPHWAPALPRPVEVCPAPECRALCAHCTVSWVLWDSLSGTHSVKNDMCPTHSQICGDICFALLFSFITVTVFRSVATSCFRRAAVYPHPASRQLYAVQVGGGARGVGLCALAREVVVVDSADGIWVSSGDCPTGEAKGYPVAGGLTGQDCHQDRVGCHLTF